MLHIGNFTTLAFKTIHWSGNRLQSDKAQRTSAYQANCDCHQRIVRPIFYKKHADMRPSTRRYYTVTRMAPS
jgi:hypothetical protein